MMKVRTLDGVGSVLSGGEWIACRYRLYLRDGGPQNKIDGSIHLTRSTGVNLTVKDKASTRLRLETKREVRIVVSEARDGPRLIIQADGQVE